MSQALADWFEELRSPLEVPDFEPDIDDKDQAKDTALREQDAIESGLIKKVVLRKGPSATIPEDGDLVYLHYNVKTPDGQVLQSTWQQEGGSGLPLPLVIGKGRRAPRAWEIALLNCRVGEVCCLSVHPRYGYKHKDCGLPPPPGANVAQQLEFTLELLQCFPKDDITLLGSDHSIIKRSISQGAVWESPRTPFEVTVSIRARLPAMDGAQCSVPPYFATPDGQPLRFAMGEGAVPAGIEQALSSMTRGEHAVISCPRGLAVAAAPAADGGECKSESLVPSPPQAAERVEFELTLQSMMQVRDMTGDGKVVKRRIKDGRGEFPVDCPIEDSSVRVHYKVLEAESGRELLDTRGPDGVAPPLKFQTGMAAVPEGLDMAVRLMTPGEVASVTADSSYAYDGRSDRPEAHASHLSAEELLARGTQLKDQGNAVFKQGMLSHATTKWLKALKLLNQIFDLGGPEQRAAVEGAKASCMVNLALAAQRQDRFTEAVSWADKALKEVPEHPKALWRRATVRAFLGELDAAEADFKRAAEADPSIELDVQREIAKMRVKASKAEQQQKKQWKGAFFRPAP